MQQEKAWLILPKHQAALLLPDARYIINQRLNLK